MTASPPAWTELATSNETLVERPVRVESAPSRENRPLSRPARGRGQPAVEERPTRPDRVVTSDERPVHRWDRRGADQGLDLTHRSPGDARQFIRREDVGRRRGRLAMIVRCAGSRSDDPATFDRRCIRPSDVAPRSHTASFLLASLALAPRGFSQDRSPARRDFHPRLTDGSVNTGLYGARVLPQSRVNGTTPTTYFLGSLTRELAVWLARCSRSRPLVCSEEVRTPCQASCPR